MTENALLLLRTPLQAWIAHSVLEREKVDCLDVVYVTSQDSSEDRKSFEGFVGLSNHASYIVAKSKRPDVFHQLDVVMRLRVALRGSTYRWHKVLLASYDLHGFNATAAKSVVGEVVTFDDGTANINSDSKYGSESMSLRERVYRRIFGGLNNRDFLKRIARHYTIFEKEAHLVPIKKLITLASPVSIAAVKSNDVVSYFIGAPFEQVLTKLQIGRLNSLVESSVIDWFVPHPRQTSHLGFEKRTRTLEKNGEIAERAIEQHAQGREIWLYGWFSTVLFTMRPRAARRVMFLAVDDSRTATMARIAKNSGCEIVEF